MLVIALYLLFGLMCMGVLMRWDNTAFKEWFANTVIWILWMPFVIAATSLYILLKITEGARERENP